MGNLLLNNNAISAKLGTKDVKLYMGESLIPQKYNKIEYIESTGEQFIATTDVYGEWNSDTDYGFWDIGSQYKIQIKYYVYKDNQTQQAALISSNGDLAPTLYHNTTNPAGMYWKFPSDSLTYYDYVQPSGSEVTNRQKKMADFNEVSESEIIYSCVSNKEEYKSYGIMLFARALRPITDTDRKIKARLYYCKIYKDDVLLMDFIPVKTFDNEVGLYDKVNNAFIKSYEGTPFIAGPNI